MYTARMTEQWELIDTVYGANVAAATETNSGWNSVQGYYRLLIVIDPVSLNDNLDVDIEQATDTSGTGSKALDSNSKDITVASTDTLPSAIEIRMEEFDVDNDFDAIQVEITTAAGSGSNYFAAKIYGLPDYAPAVTTNWDSVTD